MASRIFLAISSRARGFTDDFHLFHVNDVPDLAALVQHADQRVAG